MDQILTKADVKEFGEQPAYLNRALSAEQRAAELVRRMTVEEKVSQLVNQSRAVLRLAVARQ